MPPLLRDGDLNTLSRHPTIATSQMNTTTEDSDSDQSPSNEDLFNQLPRGKPRSFILVEDPQRPGTRVRVKVGLDKVKIQEIPDSYRKSNAVYPRTYFPTQMKDVPGLVPSKRFFRDDTEQPGDLEDSTVGRTSVPAPSLNGEREIQVPKLSRRRHRKEVLLNDLGYRLSWCQSRIFAGRRLFLQRSCKSMPFFSLSLNVFFLFWASLFPLYAFVSFYPRGYYHVQTTECSLRHLSRNIASGTNPR